MKFLLLLTAMLGSYAAQAASNENFPLKLVYRSDANPDDNRMVSFQGSLHVGQNLSQLCGPLGQLCRCAFYTSPSDRENRRVANVSSFSIRNNLLRCTIPGNADADLYTYAQIELRRGRGKTARLPIRTFLQLQDVIGEDLNANKVRTVHRYSCTKTFFEGEGVSVGGISCPASQRLGLLTSKFYYNVFTSNAAGENYSQRTTSTSYPLICERQFVENACDVPTPRYGLYSEAKEPFLSGVNLYIKEGVPALFGYVALPDSNGNCPLGLVKINKWDATPASIREGDLGNNPPSNFINEANNLDARVFDTAPPAPLSVIRRANEVPCSSTTSPVIGSCAAASFQPPAQVQEVDFVKVTPEACAIPADLLDI